ncbi:MAG: hypothetical protein ACO3A2_02165 [Bdellovibrionia bacterium]
MAHTRPSYPRAAQTKRRVLKTLSVLGLMFAILGVLAQGPDFTLNWDRTIPSRLPLEALERNFDSVTRWPNWFFSLEKVTVAQGVQPVDPGRIGKDCILRLHIRPKRAFSPSFELKAHVIQHVPHQKMALQILEDSSGRLTQLFEQIQWEVELKQNEQGKTFVQGKASAQTRNWRARLFGRLMGKALMNQIFYPDLIKLSEMKHPFSVLEGVQVPGDFGTGS